MEKLNYHYQDAWRYTTTATCQSPIDVVADKLVDGPAIAIDWSGLTISPLLKKEQVIGDQFFCHGKLVIDGQTVELVRFHIHDGFEHLWDGQSGAAELHLVFKRADGGTLVLAVFLEEDAEAGPLFAPILAGQQAQADLLTFLPAKKESILTYKGTLTTPPLKKDVDWLLLKERLGISPVDVAAFAQAYPDNYRKVQPLGNRLVVRHQITSHP
ncbi:carbonic anhydrase family protein [Fructobacillus fructosus]|uniref:carbonic anhydrase family protein n=1 Tax=Fructobacillus fructosus TaxID=1631 RepID=UPI00200A54D0|nr:carbonic anhydrase family protein [Fructobacillus fructosus]MCK8637877.1 carbonic anhydrase family protein [Fructobacillus fructosus]